MVCASALLATVAAQADHRAEHRADHRADRPAGEHSVLERMLKDGNSFRVRARAALALGRTGDSAVVDALERALKDRHAAVRAASASALGEIGARRSVPALRAAASDRSRRVARRARAALQEIARSEARRRGDAAPEPDPVPAASLDQRVRKARYAIVVAEVRDRTGGDHGMQLTQLMRDRISDELARLPRVAVFTLEEMSDAVSERLAQRRVHVFRVEAMLEKVRGSFSSGSHSVRAEVSMLLLDEPDRVLRSMLKGAATGVEAPRGPRASQRRLLARKAVSSAVRTAVSNASQAIEAASIKRDLGMQTDIRAEASLHTH
jgi:hypothetical protein